MWIGGGTLAAMVFAAWVIYCVIPSFEEVAYWRRESKKLDAALRERERRAWEQSERDAKRDAERAEKFKRDREAAAERLRFFEETHYWDGEAQLWKRYDGRPFGQYADDLKPD